MKAFAALFVRELRLANRAGGGGAMGVVFFLILVTIVPFAIGPDLNLLARIGPAMARSRAMRGPPWQSVTQAEQPGTPRVQSSLSGLRTCAR